MRRTLDRGITALVVANFVVVAILLVLVLADRVGKPSGPAQLGSGPSPAPSAELMAMGLAHIPTSNSCVLCHETGGDPKVKVVPAIGHPLEGWGRCLVCHTDEKLGRAAPGHTGIEEKECANCHKVAQDGPAITQPHAAIKDKKCLDCHGSVAHLPSSMVGRNQDECWLCHKPASSPPPRNPHPVTSDAACRTCHQSTDVGALPINHALRGDDTCLLCHAVPKSAANAGPAASPAPAG